MDTVLKISGVLLAVLIVGLAGLKLGGFDFGVRVSQNLFTDKVAGLSVFLWLMVLFGLGETLILVALFYLQRRF
jgi:hypothetical protein